MKNKKLLFITSIFASATLLSACTINSESSIQNRFNNDLLDFKNSDYLSTSIHLKSIFDENNLNGMSELEKKEILHLLEDNETFINYNKNKEQIEMILTIKVTNEIIYSDELIDVPIIIDLKENKTYIGTNWIVNFIEVIYANLINELAYKYPEKINDYDIESIKKEFNDARKSQFIELEEAKKISILLLTDIDFDSVLKDSHISNLNENKLSIKESNKLIPSFDTNYFEENDNKISLKVPNEKSEEFLNKTNLLEFSKESELLNESSLFEIIKNKDYKNLSNITILNTYNKNKLTNIHMNYDVELGLDNISYKQELKYDNIKLNKEDVQLYHDLKTLPIVSEREDILDLDDEINRLRMKAFSVYMKLNE